MRLIADMLLTSTKYSRSQSSRDATKGENEHYIPIWKKDTRFLVGCIPITYTYNVHFRKKKKKKKTLFSYLGNIIYLNCRKT